MYTSFYVSFLTLLREGEHWKRVRTAIGKQILPKNVQTNHQIYNETIHRFMNSIRSFRNADGTVKDIGDPLRKLVVECKTVKYLGYRGILYNLTLNTRI